MKLEDAARALGPPGRLSRIERDAILERVQAKQSWVRRHWVGITAGAGSAAALAVALLLIVPEDDGRRPEELAARGGGSSSGFALVVRCGERPAGECQVGDRMVFDFGGAPPVGHVALFARNELGNVIWYTPAAEDTPSSALVAHTRDGVLDTVAIIDASYTPGRYELYALVSPRPLARAEIRTLAQGERLTVPPEMKLETRTFVVAEESSR